MAVPSPIIPPQGATRLITDPGDQMVLTTVQTTDARTAIAKGLKEYVEQLSWPAPGGRLSRFRHVFETYPQAENNAEYPSACVEAVGEGKYDLQRLTPGNVVARPVDGLAIVQTAEMSIVLSLMVWGTDNKERMNLVAMLESFLTPTDWMYGLRLELPHYFGSRATYEPASMSYEDSSENALRRHRIATIMINATMPMLRVVQLPTMAPRAIVVTT